MPRGARDAPWQPSLRTGAWWKVEAVWRVVAEADEEGGSGTIGASNDSLRKTGIAPTVTALIHLTFQVKTSHRRSVRHSGPNFSNRSNCSKDLASRQAVGLGATLDPIARRCGRSLVSAGRERVGEHPTDQQNERRRVIVDAGGGRASEARRFRRAGCESAQGLRVRRASSTRLLDGGARRGRRG